MTREQVEAWLVVAVLVAVALVAPHLAIDLFWNL